MSEELKDLVREQIKQQTANHYIAGMAITYVMQTAIDGGTWRLGRHIMRHRSVHNDAEQFVVEYIGRHPGEYETPRQLAPLLVAYAKEWGFEPESGGESELPN